MKGRVLIIDDEAEIRRNLTVGLTQEDYTVVACPDGLSAIHELNHARAQGIAYDYMVTDIFMPDIEGLKILKVIKNQYPQLPVLVMTGFGDDSLEVTALSEENTGYLDKPFEISDLVKALDELSPGQTDTTPAVKVADVGKRKSISAYLIVKVSDLDRSLELYDQLYQLKGIVSCDAVRGDFDIILQARGQDMDEVQGIFDSVGALDGLEVLSTSIVVQPKLDPSVGQFIDTYQEAVRSEAGNQDRQHPGTISYIIVDIDPDAIQKIFTTVLFVDEVVFCDVIDGGSRLMGMVTGFGAMGRTPRVIEKLSQIDGVLRVREAKVIKLIED